MTTNLSFLFKLLLRLVSIYLIFKNLNLKLKDEVKYMLVKCSSCKREISANAKYCPKCGGRNFSPLTRILGTVIIIVILLDYIF